MAYSLPKIQKKNIPRSKGCYNFIFSINDLFKGYYSNSLMFVDEQEVTFLYNKI